MLAQLVFAHGLVFVCGALLCLEFRIGPAALGPLHTVILAALLTAAGFLVRRLFLDSCRQNGQIGWEAVRWMALLAAALLLTRPYARPDRVGAGDAQDYAEHLGDFLSQTKHGIFPVLVGQSRFAFNGAFNPLRTAPYYLYAGGALDALTSGLLNPYGLQNLEIILSLTAAAFSCYLLLQRLAPGRGWLSFLLSFLYVSSPGVLALIYEGDMLPSWLTLPYLPLVCYLVVQVADKGPALRRLVAIAVVTAAVWWVHAPIAMWLSLIALPVVGVRLAARPSWRERILPAAAALGAFALLAGYEFVSVAQLRLPVIPAKAAAFTGGTVLALLRESWTGFLRPVSAQGSNLLRDLQLSPALWACLAFGFLGWRRGGWGLRSLLLAALVLLALIVPLPAVAGRLWAVLPVWVGQITDQWPVQRFFPLLSAMAPFTFLLAWRALPAGWPARFSLPVFWMLSIACLWSLSEAGKLIERGYRSTLPPALSRKAIEPNNSVFSVYSYAMLGTLPRYYSFGAVSPDLQLHLLDPRTLAVSATNQDALLGGRVPAADSPWTGGFVPTPDGAILHPDLELQPGRGYLLDFRFEGRPAPGTLVLSGRSIWREFPLPASGGDRAFGDSEPWSTISLSLPEGSAPDQVRVAFVSRDAYAVTGRFATLRVLPYRVDDLPFHLLSLMPYRVAARSAEGGWLETTKIYIPGYRAQVDGKPAELARSPDGLIMLRIPAGHSEVELDYVGSALLRGAFWVSLAAWLALPIGWAALAAWPRLRRIRVTPQGASRLSPSRLWRPGGAAAPLRSPPPASPPGRPSAAPR